jgi:hypothetical protein
MANKPKPVPDSAIVYRKFGEPVEYVLNNLDEPDKARLNDAPLDPELLFQMHDKAHEMGFTCTTKWDSYSKAWQATLICNAKDAPNVGLAVSGRSHQGVSDAMFVAYFKLFHVANGDLKPFAGQSRKRDLRG